MKLINLYKTLAFTIILGFSTANISAQATQKIGGDSYNINPSAILELESTTKGFLLPRMTQVQMNAIPSPPSGMLVYCTDCGSGIGELRVRYSSSWGIPALNLSGDVNATVDVSGSNVTTIGSAKVTYDKMQRVGANTVLGNGEDTNPSYVQEIATIGTGNVVRAISPALTGTPTAPTASESNSSTQIATTAFVKSVASSSNFVNLTTDQTVAGTKTFNANMIVNGIKLGTGSSANSTNTAVGSATLSSNTGTDNTAIGASSLSSNVGGIENTAIGSLSLTSNISGVNNTAVGHHSLTNNTASNNTGVGMNSLENNTTGQYNSALGVQALQSNTDGVRNTAIGAAAIDQITTGNDNVVIGYTAGRYISDGTTNNTKLNNSILIGANTRVNAVDQTNQIVIGHNAIGNGSNTVQLGNTSITNVKTSGTITAGAVTYPNTDGSSGQVLLTDGSGTLAWGEPAPAVRELAEEFIATAAQTSFPLTQTPSVNSKVKMYVNGIRISKNAYTVSGTTLTYVPAGNGGYTLVGNERIQIDYFY